VARGDAWWAVHVPRNSVTIPTPAQEVLEIAGSFSTPSSCSHGMKNLINIAPYLTSFLGYSFARRRSLTCGSPLQGEAPTLWR
jgi:hypothetical protein